MTVRAFEKTAELMHASGGDSELLVGIHAPSTKDRGVAFADQLAVWRVRIPKQRMFTVRVTLMQDSVVIMARMLSAIALSVLVDR
jgi:hypothetical protein